MVTRKENAEYIIKSGGLQAVLDALRAHPHSEVVAKYGVEFLNAISQYEECLQALIDSGAIEVLIEILRNHMHNAEIVDGVINTLGRCAISAENVQRIVDAGGLGVLLDVIRHHTENANIVRQTLLLIETAAIMPANVQPLRDLGAMDAILLAMEGHPDDLEIQEIGGRTLGLIAGPEQLKASIETVSALTGKLSRNPQDAEVILQELGPAVRLLSNLAIVGDNVDYLVQNRAIDALLAAFTAASKLPSSEARNALLASAAQGLVRLIGTDKDRITVFDSAAFKEMVKHSLANPDNEALAESVMALLSQLAANPEVAKKMLEDGTLESILALVKAHPLNEKILAYAAQALGALALDAAAAKKILEQGGGEVVVEAIYANMENLEELLKTLEVIPLLAKDEECARKLLECGTLDAILDVLRNHPEEADIVRACIRAIGSMVVCPEVVPAVGEKGGLPLLLRALRDHYADEDLVQLDMVLLDTLAFHISNAEILLGDDLGTVELVEWAASTFEDNEIIQTAVKSLLASLAACLRKMAAEEGQVPQLSESDMQALIARLEDSKLGPAAVMSVLQELETLAMDKEQAELFVKEGGLRALATCLLNNKGNEAVYKAAALAFQKLAATVGDDVLTILEEPALIEALVEMLQPHGNFATDLSPADTARALEVMGHLASNPANVKRIIDQGALEPLLKILTTSDDPELLRAAARLLAKISNEEYGATAIGSLADLRALIAAMRKHFSNQEFLQYAVYLLGNLAYNEQMKNQIGVEGGVQVIIQCMQEYKDNKALVGNCCYSLGNLSYDCEINMSFIVACKGIEEVLGSMERSPTESDLLESCLCVLNNLSNSNDTNKKRIIDHGGAKHVVACMLDNVNEVDLLLAGFSTIGNLACYIPAVGELIKEGAVQGIVAAMTVHGRDMDAIDRAIRVLANLAADASGEHMRIMSQEGAVQAIVEVSLKHTDNLDIEIAAIGCLCNFAKEEDNARMIVRQDGLTAIKKAMEVLSFDVGLSSCAVNLIANLSFFEANSDAIIESEVSVPMIAAMQQHAASQTLLTHSMSAIANLAYSKDTAGKLAELGAIEIVIAVVNANMNNIPILLECYTALSALCRSEKNAVAMALPVMRTMSVTLQVNQGNAKYLNSAFTFLSNMCIFEGAAIACMSTDITDNLLMVLRGGVVDPQNMLRGLRALENMAITANSIKDHFVKKAVPKAMTRVQEAFTQREDIKRAAQRVIDAINNRISDGLIQKTEKKNVRDLFGDRRKKTFDDFKFPEDQRNFLLGGMLLTKHSNTAPPRPRHVYVSQDLRILYWKDPSKPLKPKQQMKTYMIRNIEKGRCTPQLQRKKRFGGYNAKDEGAFAIYGRERTVDLEAKSEAERDKWVEAIETLIGYIKHQRKINSQF